MDLVFAASICFICALTISAAAVYASTLSKESPPPPSLLIDGSLNLTADEEDIDIAIDPDDEIPFTNRTVSISTEGATDSDMSGFPPLGTTVIIQNQSISVTNNQVEIIDPGDAIPNPTPTAGNGGGNGDESDSE